MKKLSVILLLCVTLCISLVQPALAASEVPSNRIVAFYIDDSYIDTCNMAQGGPYINITKLCQTFCEEYEFNRDTGILSFKYANRSGYLKVGSATAYLNGNAVQLSKAARNDIGLADKDYNYRGEIIKATYVHVYASVDAVTKLFGLSAYTNKKTAAGDVKPYVGDKTETYVKKGEVYYTFNFTYDKSKIRYTKAQLTFMQGLASPLFLSNLNFGLRLTDSPKEIENNIKRNISGLKPLTGCSRTENNRQKYRGLMRGSWGITTREQLIRQIESLLKSGNGPEKKWIAYDNNRAVQLAQTGYLVGWLTGEEAITYGMQAAKRAQKEFNSWTEYGEYYMQGARNYLPATGFTGADVRKAYMDYLYRGDRFMKTKWDISLKAPAKAE